MIVFVLGGARSGKSAYAEALAGQSARAKLYVATCEPQDGEMQARIAAHRARRGEGWKTMEEPLAIAEIIAKAEAGSVILVDCLTLWLSNLMHHRRDVVAETETLISALRASRADIILVSNEVGQGIVPENALARAFIDHAGVVHHRVAAAADRVIWMVAGIPTKIKG